MKAIRLRTEYLKNPLGIDLKEGAPRLMWNCADGISQTAYQIRAAHWIGGKAVPAGGNQEIAEDAQDNVLWDSGKITSAAMEAPYPLPLKSRERVLWRVRLWDEEDRPGDWSEAAFFETGLLKPSDWKAQWITGNYKVDPKKRYPADCFRRRFRERAAGNAELPGSVQGLQFHGWCFLRFTC